MSKKGIVGICNPTLDSFVSVPDSFLEENGFEKNANLFLSPEKIQEVKNKVKFDVEACGGSSMNALRWIGLLGYRVGAFGQYADDNWGKQLSEGLKECYVEDRCVIKKGGVTTNFCIFVTPDAARTMMAVYGASREEYAEEVDWSFIDDYECVLLEGYHFANELLMKTIEIVIPKAIELNKKIALMMCGNFHLPGVKENILKYYKHYNIICGNEEEWLALMGKDCICDVVAELEKSHFDIASVTLAEKGSYIIKDGKRHKFSAPALEKLADTTGAGDSFAAGLLYGHFSGLPVETTGKLAAYLTGLTISKIGAVPADRSTIPQLQDFIKSC